MRRKFAAGIAACVCLVAGIAIVSPKLSDYTVEPLSASAQKMGTPAVDTEQFRSLALVSEKVAEHHQFIQAVEYVQAVEDAKLIAYSEAVEQAEAARRAAEARRVAAKEEAARKAAQAPVAPRSNTVTVTVNPGPCGGWEGLIVKHFGSREAGTACRVMMCESGGDPNALNGNPTYQAAGLFQIIKQWAEEYEAVTDVPYYDGRFDPNANTMFAAHLVREAGWASQFDCY